MNLLQQLQTEIPLQKTDIDPDSLENIVPVLRMAMMQENISILSFAACNLLSDWLKNEVDFYSLFDLCEEFPVLKDLISPVYIPEYQADQQFEEIKSITRDKPGINIIGFAGKGIFTQGTTKQMAEQRILCVLDLLRLKHYSRSSHSIDRHEFADCLDQTYRNHLIAKQNTTKLAGKIALVTGAAQGIGRGLVEILLHSGAHVVIADINLDMATETSSVLNKQYGEYRTIAVKVDVGDGASVRKMISETVAAYGGIDILVSNAGILRAGSLQEMSAADFELSTRINYTGFFLCAKHAAAVMRIQQQFRPDYYTDIIQINSKSGLTGSKKNSAYAGGKFGGIGLTQSFALELVEYNIKVNAICPGNFFEGPLWSDPEKGLFVQYLNAGKVPGAKSIQDVQRFYEEKVPMKRGCSIEDVGKALLYVIDQKYETGQAIPVTGGQVMLK